MIAGWPAGAAGVVAPYAEMLVGGSETVAAGGPEDRSSATSQRPPALRRSTTRCRDSRQDARRASRLAAEASDESVHNG